MPNPKISICIPTYNGASYLQEALDSVNAQTFKDFEVIVSDDASKDVTLNIVEKFRSKSDFAVHVFHHEPNGIGANWNNAIRHANGKYIKFLFQDDVLAPSCLEKMYAILENNKKVGLVASKREFIVNKDKSVETDKWLSTYGDLQHHFSESTSDLVLTKKLFSRKDFLSTPKNKIGEPSIVMFRKSIVNELGFFDESLKQILDYEYWYRILKKYDIYVINESLVKFRLHDLQATSVNSKTKIMDYELYPYLLYKHYFRLLHPKLQKQFFFEYNTLGKLIKKFKHAI